MKTQIDKLDAVPSKRLYLSIIADYDTPLSVCELVDNALDVWSRNGKTGDLVVEIELNQTQQTIAVKDFAGGLPRKDIANVIAPGHTGTTTSEETIGIFGVGTKRAVVALAQQVRIRTRFKKEKTLEIEFNDEWLKEDSWELPLYETTDIEPGCTVVELSKLRQQIDEASIEHLRSWLGATYGNFLNDPAIKINLNGIPVVGQHFDNWSYPPRYEPRHYHGTLTTSEGRSVAVSATAGLSNESSPATGEYGVYVYCNDRLIARALKSFDVGFIKGMAGLPHPKVSLTKVILSLSGDARDMPWNSSKSDLSPKHKVFHALQNWLIKIVSDYAQLSRIWMGTGQKKSSRTQLAKLLTFQFLTSLP